MARGSSTRSAKAVTAAPSRSGRQRTLSEKQHQNVVNQTTKENAATKKAFNEALRARQKNEEFTGFRREYSFDPESEDEGDLQPFTSVTVNSSTPAPTPAPIKTTYRNGHRLVHRVNMAAETDESARPVVPTGPRPAKRLVRRLNPDESLRDVPLIQELEGDYYEISDDNEPFSSPHSQADTTNETSNVKIRKEAPATASAATTVVTKCAKTLSAGSRGRVRASDFDDLSKSLIEGTITIYKAKLSAKHPFPERTEDREAVKESWIEVCYERNVQVELEEEVFKLVTNRAAQLRGAFKSLSNSYVLQAYNIGPQAPKRDIRDQIEGLLDGARFIYKDPAAKTGIFRAPVIQTIINKMWFRNKHDEGVIHPEFSEGGLLAVSTIALAFTVTENNLDEWVTGERVDVPFTTSAYKPKFQAHLKRIRDFEKKTIDADIIPRLQKHMLKQARKHAQAIDTITTTIEVADDDIEEAKKEWEGLVLSDED